MSTRLGLDDMTLPSGHELPYSGPIQVGARRRWVKVLDRRAPLFCAGAQHCMIHHTVYNKVNHSTVTSQERTPANLPAVSGFPTGQT